MSDAVFADTSYYAAILNRRDQFHLRAKEVGGQRWKRTISTEFVLIETANFCLKGGQRTSYLSCSQSCDLLRLSKSSPRAPNGSSAASIYSPPGQTNFGR
jgi:hypothetical protein